MCLITEHAHALEKIIKLEAQLAELEAKIAELETEEPLPTPGVRRQVGSAYIFGILNERLPQAEHIYLSDNQYWLCSKADIEIFLARDTTNKIAFTLEEWDCDDYAYRLMGQFSIPEWGGIAFGIAWTELHALNCFISEDGKFWFVEPQTSQLQSELESWQGSEILFVLM